MMTRNCIPYILAAVFLASCAMEQAPIDADVIEVLVTDDFRPLALATVSVYDLRSSKDGAPLDEVTTDDQGRAFVTYPGHGNYGIRAYYEADDGRILIATHELDGDSSWAPIVLMLDTMDGFREKGYICGEIMCCSTAPNGCCWPK